MKPNNRHLITAGVLFSALAFSGATYAQSSGTSSGSAGTPGTQSAMPSSSSSGSNGASGTQAPQSSPNAATGDRSQANSSSARNTATPPASAAAGDSGAQTPSQDRTQASAGGSDDARAGVSADAVTQPHAMRASKVIGADVQNANGDNIGDIKDMVIDLRNEQVRYVVLSHGGILGIGDKLFAYPMSMVKNKSTDSDKLVIDANQEKLKNAPGFDKNKWPDFASNQYTGEVDRYYDSSSRRDGQMPAQLVRASDLIGKNFDDRQGKNAGEVNDLIVDSTTGRVEYAVVDFDNDWDSQAKGKLVAIPLSDLAMTGEKNDKLVIDATPDRIDMSHAFASNDWPDFDNAAWAQRRSSAARSQTSSASPAQSGSTSSAQTGSTSSAQPGSASSSSANGGTPAASSGSTPRS